VQRLYDVIDWARAAELREAIPSLRRLAQHYQGRANSPIRRRIQDTLLRLKDWESVPGAIQLLEIDAASLAAPAGASDDMVGSLNWLTGQRHDRDARRWRQWWEEKGQYQAGPQRPAPAAVERPPLHEVRLVEKAFLEWARSPDGVVPGPVVYVLNSEGSRASDETIRYYRDVELRMLSVPRVRIDDLTIDGNHARVSFYGPGDFCGPGPTLELVKSDGQWAVTSQGLHYPAQILDDPRSSGPAQ
jgi:hypothetical protein